MSTKKKIQSRLKSMVVTVLEDKFKKHLQRYGFRTVMVSLHNASSHGIALGKINEQELVEVFEHYDAILKIAEKVEKRSEPLQIREVPMKKAS